MNKKLLIVAPVVLGLVGFGAVMAFSGDEEQTTEAQVQSAVDDGQPLVETARDQTAPTTDESTSQPAASQSAPTATQSNAAPAAVDNTTQQAEVNTEQTEPVNEPVSNGPVSNDPIVIDETPTIDPPVVSDPPTRGNQNINLN